MTTEPETAYGPETPDDSVGAGAYIGDDCFAAPAWAATDGSDEFDEDDFDDDFDDDFEEENDDFDEEGLFGDEKEEAEEVEEEQDDEDSDDVEGDEFDDFDGDL